MGEPVPEPAPDKDKPAAAVLPAIAYTPDHGFRLGIFGDHRWGARAGDLRKHRAAFSWNGKVWIKPGQIGWEIFSGISLVPWKDGSTEIVGSVITFGRLWDLWFGLGQGQLRDLREHEGAPDEVKIGWHRWRYYRVRWDARVYRVLTGKLRGVVGLGGSWNHVDPLRGTLLRSQTDAGHLPGEQGGITLAVDTGFLIDARNEPIAPTRGVFAVGLMQVLSGPDGPWTRALADVRLWWGPSKGEMTVCGRVMIQAALGSVPLYEYGVFAALGPTEPTVSGPFGMRGLDRGRLRGPLTALGMIEARFRPPGVRLFSWLRLRLAPVAWFDAVRVDTLPRTAGGWPVQPAMGGGVRLIVNELTVTRLDIGTAPERVLDDDGVRTRWTFAVYGTVNHPF